MDTILVSQPARRSNSERYVGSSFKTGDIFTFTEEFVTSQDLEQVDNFDVWTNEENGHPKLQGDSTTARNLHPHSMSTQISIVSIETEAAKTNGSSSAFSDTSSDVSDITTSLPSASSGSAYVLPVVEGISEQDISQVDIFYRSHKTEVRVCRSLANLYVSTPKLKTKTPEPTNPRAKSKSFKEKKSKSAEHQPPSHPAPSDFSKEEWTFTKTGIPALVLDTGDHVREKRLKIVLAEKGTGFTLWQDQINQFTEYSTPHSNFHTITISTDSSRLVGFSFDEGKAAAEFADAVRGFMSNANEDLLNLNSKKKKKKDKPKQKYKPPKKVDISNPVCFVHVTKLQRPDLVAGLFPPPPSGVELDRLGIPRAVSDSSGISECSSRS